MKFAFLAWLTFPFAGQLLAAEPAHALRQGGREAVFHYGEMHGGAAPRGASHLVVALFDAAKGERIANADVTASVTLLGGGSVTKRLEPMTIPDQPSFGGFFSLGVPGIDKLRFEARRPGTAQAAAADFEYPVSPEGRR